MVLVELCSLEEQGLRFDYSSWTFDYESTLEVILQMDYSNKLKQLITNMIDPNPTNRPSFDSLIISLSDPLTKRQSNLSYMSKMLKKTTS